MEQTIAAISTPMGMGGIAIIRMSGEQAIEIAHKIYRGKADFMTVPTHTIHYGKVMDMDTMEVIDEALFTIMRAPHTFTGENVVEINVHGSAISAKAVLSSLISAGAQLAGPGEFTKRAFLNGKMDLAQAEAVIDIIESKTTSAHTNAVSQLGGHLSQKIDDLRERLLDIAAHIGVSIDYVDEGYTTEELQKMANEFAGMIAEIDTLLMSAKSAKFMKEGILTAIVGSPNVGKSSVLNMLAGNDRAIVTNIAGTTRDVIEEQIDLGDFSLRLADTAGIRKANDAVEKIGIERSYEYLNQADLVMLVLDGSGTLSSQDKEVFQKSKEKKRIVLINKTDLAVNIEEEELVSLADGAPIIRVSAKTGEGKEALLSQIRDLFFRGIVSQNMGEYITNERHKEALIHAKQHLSLCLETLQIGECVDLVCVDLNDAIADLGEIVGQSVTEEVVDRIFSRFCVGK